MESRRILQEKTCDQLTARLKAVAQPVSDSKQELIDRLFEFDKSNVENLGKDEGTVLVVSTSTIEELGVLSKLTDGTASELKKFGVRVD